jgi:C4-dicarboxylate transporter
MSRSRLSLICMSICAVLLAVPHAIVTGLERAASFIFDLIPALAAEPRIATNGPALAFAMPGRALDAALQNSLRHEAGMRPLT